MGVRAIQANRLAVMVSGTLEILRTTRTVELVLVNYSQVRMRQGIGATRLESVLPEGAAISPMTYLIQTEQAQNANEDDRPVKRRALALPSASDVSTVPDPGNEDADER